MTPEQTVDALQHARFRLVQNGWTQATYSKYITQYNDGRKNGPCCLVGSLVTCPTSGFGNQDFCECDTKPCPSTVWQAAVPELAVRLDKLEEDDGRDPWRVAHDQLVDWNDAEDRTIDEVLVLIDRTIAEVQS